MLILNECESYLSTELLTFALASTWHFSLTVKKVHSNSYIYLAVFRSMDSTKEETPSPTKESTGPDSTSSDSKPKPADKNAAHDEKGKLPAIIIQ